MRSLEWYVYVGHFNSRNIETFNIFDNTRFLEDCKKAARKCKDEVAFAEEVHRALMYYYWSKCEWEVIISHWPSRDGDRDAKVDVYDQVFLNWERFIDYLWAHRKELRRRDTTNENH